MLWSNSKLLAENILNSPNFRFTDWFFHHGHILVFIKVASTPEMVSIIPEDSSDP